MTPGSVETLAIFGATGNTGKYMIPKALARGFKVRAMARTPEKITEINDNLTVIQGDFANKAAIQETVQGADYVICAAGGRAGEKDYDEAMMTNFVKVLYETLSNNSCKVKVFLYQGGAATPTMGKDLPWRSKIFKYTLGWMLGLHPMFRDNVNVMKFMYEQESAVSFHTIHTRPGLLKEQQQQQQPEEKEQLLQGVEEAGSFVEVFVQGISFAALASFNLDALKDETLYGTCPYVRRL